MDHYLVKTQIDHTRFTPKKRRFSYAHAFFLLNMKSLSSFNKLIRYFPMSLIPQDHFLAKSDNFLSELSRFCKEKYQLEIDNAYLLTNIRQWGFQFNPLSIYFLIKDKEMIHVLAEVGNTFGEQKYYLLSPTGNKNFEYQGEKKFYVSPFIALNTYFHFKAKWQNEKISLSVKSSNLNQELILLAQAQGNIKPLSFKTLLFHLLRYPFASLRVLFLIHWQALLLYLKGLPFIRKNENLDIQQGVYNGPGQTPAFSPSPKR